VLWPGCACPASSRGRRIRRMTHMCAWACCRPPSCQTGTGRIRALLGLLARGRDALCHHWKHDACARRVCTVCPSAIPRAAWRAPIGPAG
jgi:hypothetical protein